MKRFLVGVLVLAGALSAFAEENPWSFSAGYKHRYNIDTDVRGGTSYSAGHYGAGAGAPPAVTGVGAPGATDDRAYDDGYVDRDVGTDTPGPRQGLTWNYEYENADQYDPAADTLSFTKTATGPLNGNSAPAFREFEDQANGIQFRLNRLLVEKDRLRISAVFAASYFREEDHEISWSDYSATVANVTDTYDLQGVDPSVRHNPNLDGNLYGAPTSPTDPRPVIDNIPTTRTHGTDVYANNVDYSMDYDLITVGAGLEFEWAIHDRVSLYVSPRLERYRMDIDTRRKETITDAAGTELNQWNDSASDHEYFWGVVLEGGVQAMVTETWFVRVHGDAIQTWDSVEVKTGPTTMSMDMSGWSWGVDLGVTF